MNEHRWIEESRVTVVVRAVRSGVRHLTVVHSLHSPAADSIDLTAPCGPAPAVRFLPEVDCVAADIPLGRALARNETAVIEYTLRSVCDGGVSHQHERRVSAPLQAYLLHMRFHPRALPSTCRRTYRRQPGTEPEYRDRVPLDAARTAHLMPAKCPPDVHGLEWEWPKE
ncbi:hypothetical protein [Streptomyces roseolilacinus]|uniref:hypothetical protein n=1 Tax=Streptomyces roseolilacinus TaxID=66904 RepID=UPI00382A7BFC